MEWREIDTMLVSKCIQFVEREISDGKLEASRFVPVPELKESQAFAFYKAWRVHLVDRMIEESDKNLSKKFSNPTKELEDDIRYFKKVQEKERAATQLLKNIRSRWNELPVKRALRMGEA